jgi:hypothetical protein
VGAEEAWIAGQHDAGQQPAPASGFLQAFGPLRVGNDQVATGVADGAIELGWGATAVDQDCHGTQ